MNIVMKTVFGSHLYGLDTPESDTDYKGIYLPTLEELLLNSYKPYINLDSNKKGKNNNSDVDMEWIALPAFIELACKGETVALDMLHSNVAEGGPKYGYIWNELQKNRHLFYTKRLKSYAGYLKSQVHKYSNKGKKLQLIHDLIKMLSHYHPSKTLNEIWGVLPTGRYLSKGVNSDESRMDTNTMFWSVLGSKYQETIRIGYCMDQLQKKYDGYGTRAKKAEQSSGVDWKAVSHAMRAGYQLIAIYKDGSFTYPLPESNFIKEIKAGEHNYEDDVEPELNRILAEIESLVEDSEFPEKVDSAFWDKWLLDVYANELINTGETNES